MGSGGTRIHTPWEKEGASEPKTRVEVTACRCGSDQVARGPAVLVPFVRWAPPRPVSLSYSLTCHGSGFRFSPGARTRANSCAKFPPCNPLPTPTSNPLPTKTTAASSLLLLLLLSLALCLLRARILYSRRAPPHHVLAVRWHDRGHAQLLAAPELEGID